MKYKAQLINLIKSNINDYVKSLPPEKQLKLLVTFSKVKYSMNFGARLTLLGELIKQGKINIEELVDEALEKYYSQNKNKGP